MSVQHLTGSSSALPSAHPGASRSDPSSMWVAQAEIAPKGRPGHGCTLVQMHNGNYLTIGHNLLKHFGVNTADPKSVERFIRQNTGDVKAHSPIFRSAEDSFDVALEVSPKLLRRIRDVEINKAGAGVRLQSGPQPPSLEMTRKQFRDLKFIGVKDSAPAGAVKIHAGQSGGVLVDPKSGAPLYMVFAAGETWLSRIAVGLSNRFGRFPVANQLSSPLFDASRRANIAYYVSLSTNPLSSHLIEHNRTDGTVFQLFSDGTRTELR